MAQEQEIEQEGVGIQTEEVEVEVPEDLEDQPIEVEEVESESDNFTKAESATQKRIDKLTKKMRTAEREREAALKYAQQVQQESNDLKSRLGNLDQNYINEFSSRVETQMTTAEQNLARAIEMGDTNGVIEAQRAITQLAIENDRAKQAKLQSDRYAQQLSAQREVEVQQPMPQQTRRPDPKAEDWAERNEWFGTDETMTYAAFGIHKKLVESEGFDPQSDDYYTELDSRIREEFPHKFRSQQTGEARRPAQTVAPATRGTTGRNSKKVRLSKSQLTIAKKLGVPPEEYAKYVKE